MKLVIGDMGTEQRLFSMIISSTVDFNLISINKPFEFIGLSL